MPAPISEYVPQFVSVEEGARGGRAALCAWSAVTAAALLTVAVIVLAPLARAGGHPLASAVAYRVFSAACHQMPERSFHLAGFPLAVCARCLGLYAGGLAGLLLYPALAPLGRTRAPWRGWLLMAAAPTAADFALGFFGVWENTHWSRLLTALPAGAACAFYVVPALVELGAGKFRQASPRPSASAGHAGGGVEGINVKL